MKKVLLLILAVFLLCTQLPGAEKHIDHKKHEKTLKKLSDALAKSNWTVYGGDVIYDYVENNVCVLIMPNFAKFVTPMIRMTYHKESADYQLDLIFLFDQVFGPDFQSDELGTHHLRVDFLVPLPGAEKTSTIIVSDEGGSNQYYFPQDQSVQAGEETLLLFDAMQKSSMIHFNFKTDEFSQFQGRKVHVNLPLPPLEKILPLAKKVLENS